MADLPKIDLTPEDIDDLAELHVQLTKAGKPKTAAHVARLMGKNLPKGMDEKYPTYTKALDVGAQLQKPVTEHLGIPTLTESYGKYLPKAGEGGALAAAGPIGRAALGLGDFLLTPAGLAALTAEVASGGTATPFLMPAFGAQMGVGAYEAGKEAYKNPTPENVESAAMSGAFAAMGAIPSARARAATQRLEKNFKRPSTPPRPPGGSTPPPLPPAPPAGPVGPELSIDQLGAMGRSSTEAVVGYAPGDYPDLFGDYAMPTGKLKAPIVAFGGPDINFPRAEGPEPIQPYNEPKRPGGGSAPPPMPSGNAPSELLDDPNAPTSFPQISILPDEFKAAAIARDKHEAGGVIRSQSTFEQIAEYQRQYGERSEGAMPVDPYAAKERLAIQLEPRAERRIAPQRRTFNDWLLAKKNITQDQLMQLPADEQVTIRGEFGKDSSFHVQGMVEQSIAEREGRAQRPGLTREKTSPVAEEGLESRPGAMPRGFTPRPPTRKTGPTTRGVITPAEKQTLKQAGFTETEIKTAPLEDLEKALEISALPTEDISEATVRSFLGVPEKAKKVSPPSTESVKPGIRASYDEAVARVLGRWTKDSPGFISGSSGTGPMKALVKRLREIHNLSTVAERLEKYKALGLSDEQAQLLMETPFLTKQELAAAKRTRFKNAADPLSSAETLSIDAPVGEGEISFEEVASRKAEEKPETPQEALLAYEAERAMKRRVVNEMRKLESRSDPDKPYKSVTDEDDFELEFDDWVNKLQIKEETTPAQQATFKRALLQSTQKARKVSGEESPSGSTLYSGLDPIEGAKQTKKLIVDTAQWLKEDAQRLKETVRKLVGFDYDTIYDDAPSINKAAAALTSKKRVLGMHIIMPGEIGPQSLPHYPGAFTLEKYRWNEDSKKLESSPVRSFSKFAFEKEVLQAASSNEDYLIKDDYGRPWYDSFHAGIEPPNPIFGTREYLQKLWEREEQGERLSTKERELLDIWEKELTAEDQYGVTAPDRSSAIDAAERKKYFETLDKVRTAKIAALRQRQKGTSGTSLYSGLDPIEGAKQTKKLIEDTAQYVKNLYKSGLGSNYIHDLTSGKRMPAAGWIFPDKKTFVDTHEDGHFATLLMLRGPKFGAGRDAWNAAGKHIQDFLEEGAIRKSSETSYQMSELTPENKFVLEQDLRNQTIPDSHVLTIDTNDAWYKIPMKDIRESGYNLDIADEYKSKLKTQIKTAEEGFGSEKALEGMALKEEFLRFEDKRKATAVARRRAKESGFISLGMLDPTAWLGGARKAVVNAARNVVKNQSNQTQLPQGFDPKMDAILRKQSEKPQISTLERLSELPLDTVQKIYDLFVRFPGSKSQFMRGSGIRANEIEARLGRKLPDEENPVRLLHATRGGYGGHVGAAALQFSSILRRASKAGLADHLNAYLNYRAYDREARILSDRANRLQAAGETKEADALRARLNNGEALPMKFTPEEVTQKLSDMQSHPEISAKMTEVERLANEVYKVTSQFLEDINQEGLITSESYQRYKSNGADYVSLMRDFSDIEQTHGSFGRSQMDLKTMNLINKLEGSERVNINPLEATLAIMRRGYNMAGRNNAMNILREFRTTDAGGWALEMTPSGKVGKNGQFVWDHEAAPPKGQTRIGLYNQGVKETYFMPKELGEVLTNVDPLYTHLGVNILQRLAADALRTTAIGSNIAFTAANIARDTLAAAFFRHSNPKIRLRIGPFARDWVNVIRKGVLDTSSERTEFLRSRAAFSTMTQSIAPDIMFEMQKGIGRTILTGHPFKGIAQFSGLVEEATKRAVYKGLREAGLTETQAALHTRRYGGSPDFAAGGQWKDWLNLTFLFSNARLQGLGRTIAYTRDNPKRTAQLMATATVLTAALQGWNSQFKDEEGESLYAQLTPQEKSNYWVIMMPGPSPASSTGTRMPPRILIPKPYEVQQMMLPVEKLLEKEAFSNKGLGKQDALDIISAISPLQMNLRQGRIAQSAFEGLAASVNPAFGAPLEQASGKGGYEYFYERPIVPEYLSTLEREFQYRPTTSGTAQAMGRGEMLPGAVLGAGLGSVLGGYRGAMVGGVAGAAASKFHPSPLRTEALLRRVAGGVGQSILRASDIAYKTPEQETIPLSRQEKIRNIPFLGDIARRMTGGPLSGVELEVNDKFYTVATRAQEVHDTLTYLKKSNIDKLEDYLQRPDTMKMLQAEKVTTDIRKRVSQLQAKERTIQVDPDMDRESKLELLETLTKQRESLLKMANELLGELLEETQ